MTLQSAIDEFLTYLLSEKGDSLMTINAYEVDLLGFKEFLSNVDISLINSDDLLKYQSKLKNDGLKTSSIRRKTMAIKGLFSYLNKNGYISLNYKELPLAKNEKKLPTYLTVEEVQSIISQINMNTEKGLLDLLIILISFSCGLRVSEIVNLRIDHIFLDANYIKIYGKRKKERILPINEELKDYIKLYMTSYRNKIKENNLYFFVHKNGNLISRQYVFLIVKKYAKMANINKNISPHTLRHSYATNLLLNGALLRQVQVLLGHDDIQTTEIYTHITHQKEKEEYEKAMKR